MNIKHLPNLLTGMNLLCGCVAILSVFHGNVPLVGAMVFLALLFDYLDGLLARALNVHSELGKNLDALADMVTFGVVPGMILYHLFIRHPAGIYFSPFWWDVFKYVPFVFPLAAAWRLARFNADTRQKNLFLGLPVPAAGSFVTALPLIVRYDTFHLAPYIENPYIVTGLTLVLAWLMVSDLPLFNLKFANLSWHDNRLRFVFLALAAVVVAVFRFAGIPVAVVLYILLSIVHFQLSNNKAPA